MPGFYIYRRSDLVPDFPRRLPQFVALYDLFRTSAGHKDSAAIRRYSDPIIILALKENILERLERCRRFNSNIGDDEKTVGNDALALLQLMRYFNTYDAYFNWLLLYYVKRNNSEFYWIISQRIKDIELRIFPPSANDIYEAYSLFAAGRLAQGDIEGAGDAFWRSADGLIKCGEYQKAREVLDKSKNLIKSVSKPYHLIKTMPTETNEDKLGNIARYKARISREEGASYRIIGFEGKKSRREFEDSERHSAIALSYYSNTNPPQVHGMANTYYELALLAAARACLYPSYWHNFRKYIQQAKAHYRMASDNYKILVTDRRSQDPFGRFHDDD